MTTAKQAEIVTDYLVVGAGLSGLAFVDELLTRTDATVTLIDKRDLPGGHWVDTYPFVRLHQPSGQYGVNSTELSTGIVDTTTLQKGLLDLASGAEVRAYCNALVRDKFLPSGRVTFLPSTEYREDGTIKQLVSGKVSTVKINKRLVDAAWYTNNIPLLHTRLWSVDEDVPCVPPNYLPSRAGDFENFTVLGAGKTAMDCLLWLMERGVDPARIRWIMPSDYWMLNRKTFQGKPEFFKSTFEGLTALFGNVASSSSSTELVLAHENAGLLLRIDPDIQPKQFHAATLAEAEVEELRRIKDIVRLGHVKSITADKLVLTKGELAAKPNTLYVDCTACCLPDKPLVPVFQPGKIVPQIIRYPLICYSSSKIAFLESLDMTDEERNNYAEPIKFYKEVDGYVSMIEVDMRNRVKEMENPTLAAWITQSRIDKFTGMARSVKLYEVSKLMMLRKFMINFQAAAKNAPTLSAAGRAEMKAVSHPAVAAKA